MIKRYSRPEMEKIWSDENKFQIWLDVELLACEAQQKIGNIPIEALRKIKQKAKFDIKRILEIENTTKHDVIAFLTNISEKMGAESRYIHMGMTSSDVLDTSLSVQLKMAGLLLLKVLMNIKNTLKQKARKYKHLIMIGRTHGIHAEPITLGLKFALWMEETNRNIERLKHAIEIISVGQISGAVGTYEFISPKVEKYVCTKLGLKPANISTQILQRDRHAQYMQTLSLIASCIEKYSTEIRHLQKTEVLELEEYFSKGQKGSSAMPHKKNPITSEQLSGLARVIRGNSISSLENIVLWHERDISHSSVERIIFPDSTILLDYMLNKFNDLIGNIVVYEKNIKKNLELTLGLTFSQAVLLKLIDKNMKREKAYKIVQDTAMKCWKEKISFKKLILKDKETMKYLTINDLEEIFNQENIKRNVNFIFKRLKI
jgi:adenylosuccinate lyase